MNRARCIVENYQQNFPRSTNFTARLSCNEKHLNCKMNANAFDSLIFRRANSINIFTGEIIFV